MDGNPEGTPNPNCNGIIDNPYGFYLGTLNPNIWSTSYYFNGAIDEARIWDTARSQAEIQADMNRELTGSEGNLIGLWHLNEGEGLRIEDAAGGHHDGILGAPPHTPNWITPCASVGEKIVYCSKQDGQANPDIYIMNPDGSDVV